MQHSSRRHARTPSRRTPRRRRRVARRARTRQRAGHASAAAPPALKSLLVAGRDSDDAATARASRALIAQRRAAVVDGLGVRLLEHDGLCPVAGRRRSRFRSCVGGTQKRQQQAVDVGTCARCALARVVCAGGQVGLPALRDAVAARQRGASEYVAQAAAGARAQCTGGQEERELPRDVAVVVVIIVAVVVVVVVVAMVALSLRASLSSSLPPPPSAPPPSAPAPSSSRLSTLMSRHVAAIEAGVVNHGSLGGVGRLPHVGRACQRGIVGPPSRACGADARAPAARPRPQALVLARAGLACQPGSPDAQQAHADLAALRERLAPGSAHSRTRASRQRSTRGRSDRRHAGARAGVGAGAGAAAADAADAERRGECRRRDGRRRWRRGRR